MPFDMFDVPDPHLGDALLWSRGVAGVGFCRSRSATSTAFSQLEFTTATGKKVELNGESEKECINSCKQADEFKATDTLDLANFLEGGETQNVADCVRFCQTHFELFCFPGDSTVVLRDRGSVSMRDVQIGDRVMSATQSVADNSWELSFDRVIGFIHADTEIEADVLRIQHALGTVELTGNHIIFSATDSDCAGVLAEDLRVGDRVLAPWIDGTVVPSEVRAITRLRRKGLFAPLLVSGTLLVDGTVASCYAMPKNISGSDLFHRLSVVSGGSGPHAVAHALFLPLRLYLLAATPPSCPQLDTVANSVRDQKPKPMKDVLAGVHPYAWALYVAASSFVA